MSADSPWPTSGRSRASRTWSGHATGRAVLACAAVVTTVAASSAWAVEPGAPTDPAKPAGKVLLSDDFEGQTGSAPSGAWTVKAKSCTGAGVATVDRTTGHSGTTSMKVVGGPNYCDHTFIASTTPLTSLAGGPVHVRFFVKHTNALAVGHVAFAAFEDSADGGKDLRVGGQSGALQLNRESDDATLPAQSPAGVAKSVPLPTGSWQCLEIAVEGAAGTASAWLNGTEVAGLLADGTKTPDIDDQWYGKPWHPRLEDLRLGWESYHGVTDTLWFDDVVVSSGRIGCERPVTAP